MTVTGYPSPRDPFADFIDRCRCREIDGERDRCQLVVGSFRVKAAGLGVEAPAGAAIYVRYDTYLTRDTGDRQKTPLYIRILGCWAGTLLCAVRDG
jgi:hypothetical protein